MHDKTKARREINLKVALKHAKAGIYVYPSVDKVPLVVDWTRADTLPLDTIRAERVEKYRAKHNEEPTHVGATIDEAAIRKLWARYPDATPSISLGPSGLFVLDADKKDDGPVKIGQFFKPHGGLPHGVAVTVTQSAGRHIFFKNTAGHGNVAGRFKSEYGCDVKGIGGQVVAPGSIRDDGAIYRRDEKYPDLTIAFMSDTLPPVPDYVLAVATTPASREAKAAKADDKTAAVIAHLSETDWPDADDLLDPLLGYDIDGLCDKDDDLKQLIESPSEDRSANRWTLARALLREWPNMPAEHYASIVSSFEFSGEFVDGKAGPGEYDYRQLSREWLGGANSYKISDGDFGKVEDDSYGSDTAPQDVQAKLDAIRAKDRPFTAPEAYAFTDINMLDPRKWEYGHAYMRGVVSLLGAYGGRGKSLLQMSEAIAMATGKPLLGVQAKRQLRVLLWNGEDSQIELQRRAGTLMQHHEMSQDEIADRLYFVSGIDMPLTFVSGQPGGFKIETKTVANVTKFIQAHNIDVALFDPIVSLHTLNEIDNTAMNALYGVFTKMAADLNIAIGIATHVRKGQGKDETITANDIRGGGAAVAAARVARVINKLKESDAVKIGLQRAEAWQYSVVSDEKGNYAPLSRNGLVVKIDGVQADNARDGYDADSNPLMTLYVPRYSSDLLGPHMPVFMSELKAGEWIHQAKGKTSDRWVGALIARLCGLNLDNVTDRDAIKQAIDGALASKRVKTEIITQKNGKAIYVLKPVDDGLTAVVDDEDEPL